MVTLPEKFKVGYKGLLKKITVIDLSRSCRWTPLIRIRFARVMSKQLFPTEREHYLIPFVNLPSIRVFLSIPETHYQTYKVVLPPISLLGIEFLGFSRNIFLLHYQNLNKWSPKCSSARKEHGCVSFECPLVQQSKKKGKDPQMAIK